MVFFHIALSMQYTENPLCGYVDCIFGDVSPTLIAFQLRQGTRHAPSYAMRLGVQPDPSPVGGRLAGTATSR